MCRGCRPALVLAVCEQQGWTGAGVGPVLPNRKPVLVSDRPGEMVIGDICHTHVTAGQQRLKPARSLPVEQDNLVSLEQKLLVTYPVS